MLNKMLNNIFSVEKFGTRKIIKIFGLKIKLLDLKPEIYAVSAASNRNILALLYNQLNFASNDDLFCLKSGNITFILHKGCLNLDYKFFKDYILPSGYQHNYIELIKLDRSCVLYKEHIPRVTPGEFLWKYVERYYFIAHSFISTDDEGNIFINSSYVPEKNQVKSSFKIQHIPLISKRKYINGITVTEHLEGKSFEEKLIVVDKLLNFLFSTYKDEENPDKVSGNLFDCHLDNFLIGDDGQFHFIDFDLKCTEALDKGYCIHFMLYRYDLDLYKQMLKAYGLKDRSAYYANNFSIYKQPLVENGKSVITKEHINLQKKYFGELGIRPEFKLNYEKADIK